MKSLTKLAAAAALATAMNSPALMIEGGTEQTVVDGNNVLITCQEGTGTLVVTEEVDVQVLLVAGGGGGGDANDKPGGGGGAGGVIYQSLHLLPGSYAYTVGAGGAHNANGGDSTFADLTAVGGGAGGYDADGGKRSGSVGGSGGGAGGFGNSKRVGANGTENQGNKGGDNFRQVVGDTVFGRVHTSNGQGDCNYAGGGGGAGAPGGNAYGVDSSGNPTDVSDDITDGRPGNGGDGVACSITGEEKWYGGGGGGGQFGWYKNDRQSLGGKGGGGDGGFDQDYRNEGGNWVGWMRNGVDGEPGTGGGGGGGGGQSREVSSLGGAGGSGILLIRYTDTGLFREMGPECTGGVATKTGNVMVHVFTESGTFTLPRGLYCDVLVVAGGGGGGDGLNGAGGGGGAGGVLYQQHVGVLAGTHTVTVGAGGAVATKGGNSEFAGLVAIGGGAGGQFELPPDMSGGSGGGADGCANWRRTGGAGTEGQGHRGSDSLCAVLYDSGEHREAKRGDGSWINAGGGGGGAGEAGHDPYLIVDEKDCTDQIVTGDKYYGGDGGDGIPCSITGEEVWYGGGGGGGDVGWYRSGMNGKGGQGGGGDGGFYQDYAHDGNPENGYKQNATAGVDGTGGGGGGGGSGNGHKTEGAAGGSGIVIIRYLLAPPHTIVLLR